jgi:hypothetical protein
MLARFVDTFPGYKPHWEHAGGGALTYGASPIHAHHH